MDINQLTSFVKVAETKSVGQAAKELFVTQPAVSKQIKALENELGTPLFDRIGKKVHLTRAGLLLLDYAERILRTLHDARNAVRDLTEECSGDLVVGTSDHISLHRLPPVLKRYIAAYPAVNLVLRCHRSETILEMVQRNQVDLGVITLPVSIGNLMYETIWQDPMSLVFPPDHPLAMQHAIRLRDIVHHEMILPETGTTTRKVIDAAFSRKGLVPTVSMEVAYLETIKVLVKVGLGLSILPDKAIEQELLAGTLRKASIQDAAFSRALGVVFLRDKFLSLPAREFLTHLRASGVGS